MAEFSPCIFEAGKRYNSGMTFVLEGIAYGSLAGLSGLHGVIQYGRTGSDQSLSLPRSNWLNLILPALMCGLFGTIFILANPDLATALGENVSWFIGELEARLLDVLPRPLQLLFWLATAWLTIGIFRPIVNTALTEDTTEDVVLAKQAPAVAPQFEALRNTLGTLIVLFAIYLVFEFRTLWFRDFPEGFYYAGYAHKGAAWLTAALALATLVLSAVFRGRVLSDSRLNRLHWLAWIWSLENLLLALAVYNRLLIYVGFNGMTWMRVLGFFGVTTVVAGFVVVLWKIHHDRNFLWLVRRQLLTVFVAGYLFLLTPVDVLVVTYNTRRILNGDSAACMQIGVQETNTEALPSLLPLLDCQDDQIRRGVAALLAEGEKKLETRVAKQQRLGWTAAQLAEPAVLRKLNQHRDRWSDFSSDRDREAALEAFYDYAYQWY